jgi:hypothetical protein
MNIEHGIMNNEVKRAEAARSDSSDPRGGLCGGFAAFYFNIQYSVFRVHYSFRSASDFNSGKQSKVLS